MKSVWRLLVAAALVITSCGGAAPATTLPPDAGTVLAAAAQAMGAIDYVRFKIERTGAPVYIDPAHTLNFKVAEGQFAAPSSANAVVTLAVGNLNAQIGAIAINGKTRRKITEIFNDYFPKDAFEFWFLEDRIYQNTAYQIWDGVNKTFKFFSILAILISIIGLFGLISFTAKRRVKEMGIRKVFG